MIKYSQMYSLDIYISITTFDPKFNFFLHNLSKGCWSLVFHKINIWLFNTFWWVQPWGLFIVWVVNKNVYLEIHISSCFSRNSIRDDLENVVTYLSCIAFFIILTNDRMSYLAERRWQTRSHRIEENIHKIVLNSP